MTYSKVSAYMYRRSTYADSRVASLKHQKKLAWQKKQKEINPGIEDNEENEKPRKQGKAKGAEDQTQKDKRKFKKIFGMNDMKPACSTGT